jgi:hypothetical protein
MMEPSNPFGDEQWPYGLRAINYLVRQLRLEDAATTAWEQACLMLHTRLRDGCIRSRWERGQLPPSFWQFAKIDEDGDAVTRSTAIVPVNDPGNPSLRAFNVNAADVLRLWPIAEAGEPAAKGPPVHAETPAPKSVATKSEIRQFLAEKCRGLSETDTLKTVQERFDISRSRVRTVRNSMSWLKRKPGRPRKQSSI